MVVPLEGVEEVVLEVLLVWVLLHDDGREVGVVWVAMAEDEEQVDSVSGVAVAVDDGFEEMEAATVVMEDFEVAPMRVMVPVVVHSILVVAVLPAVQVSLGM